MVDEDETGSAGQEGTAVFLIAVNPALNVAGVHLAGRQHNLALDLISPFVKRIWRAIAHVHDDSFPVGRRRMGQANAGDDFPERAEDFQFDFAAPPADILDGFQVNVAEAIRF